VTSSRRRALALALLVPLVAGCHGLSRLEPRRSDPLPVQAGKVIVLVPVVAVGICLVVVAAAAQCRYDPMDDAAHPRHPDFAPGPLQQIR